MVALALVAAACGDDDEGSESTAAEVRESGTVRIGVRNDNPPMSFIDVADDPLTCVARGGGRVLELMDEHGPAMFGLD